MKDWLGIVAVTQRILLELWRRKASLICWAIFPVSILVVNAMILAERNHFSTAQAYGKTAPPSLVGAALFFSCLGGSIATVVAEREQRTLKRLFTTPLSGISYFLGIFLAHGAIGIGQSLLIYAVAAFAGAEFKGSPLLGCVIICLSMMAYVGVGFCMGTQLARRTEDVNALIAAFGVPSLLLGGAFIPIEFLPKVLRQVAKFNPIYHMIEALSGATFEGKGLAGIALHFNFLVGFAGLMVGCGWLSYRQMLRTERI